MTFMFACRSIKIQHHWLHWGLTNIDIWTKLMDKGTKFSTVAFFSFLVCLVKFSVQRFCLVILLLPDNDNSYPDCQHNIFGWTCGCWLFICNDARSLEHNRHSICGTGRCVSKKCEFNWWIKKLNCLLVNSSKGY